MREIARAGRMAFHPSSVPLGATYDVTDERGAAEAAGEIAAAWSPGRGTGFKVLMPKDKRLARRMGHTVMTTVSYLLRKAGKGRDVRYWVYHEDAEHYAIVLVDSETLGSLEGADPEATGDEAGDEKPQ